MSFDFGVLQPYVKDAMITDIDSNGRSVYVTHVLKGKSRVAQLEDGYLEQLLNRLCNAGQSMISLIMSILNWMEKLTACVFMQHINPSPHPALP